MTQNKLAYNERIKWITSLCNTLASASLILGMLTPSFAQAVTYWYSVPASMLLAAGLLTFSMWLLGDLLAD